METLGDIIPRKLLPNVMKDFLRTLEINQFMTDYVVMGPEYEPLSEFIVNEKALDRPDGKRCPFLPNMS